MKQGRKPECPEKKKTKKPNDEFQHPSQMLSVFPGLLPRAWKTWTDNGVTKTTNQATDRRVLWQKDVSAGPLME